MPLEEAAPGCVRLPFVILIDKQEKAPWSFTGLRARSFIDKEMREYTPQTEPRTLGVGMGDYSMDGYQDRIAIERKSMQDFQGTLLGWPVDATDPQVLAEWDARKSVDRRKRFKNELRKLATMETAAVVIEADLWACVCPENAPEWGKRTAAENGKYIFATALAWMQEFRVPWYFCADRRLAEVTAFRLLEKFWHRTERERREAARQTLFPPEKRRRVKRWKLISETVV